MRTLDVLHHNGKLGTLSESDGVWALVYDLSWVACAEAFDLSPALPRHAVTHRDAGDTQPVRWHFANLLPEERLRRVIAAEANVDAWDDFALLAHLGEETTGAFCFRPPSKPVTGPGGLHHLSDEALQGRIKNLTNASLTRDAPQKSAIAGAQDKMALVYQDGSFLAPSAGASSTHIIKPNHPGDQYPSSAFNEYLTMSLAAEAGVTVPLVFRKYVPAPVYIVQRFDRAVDKDGTPYRRHVIDACQLLNMPAADKYGLATLQALTACSVLCNDPIATRMELYRWLTFNILIGNDDNHLKNLSFWVDANGIELAPAYDLLSTAAYRSAAFADGQAQWPEVRMMIPLPGASTFGHVTRHSLLAAGQELGLNMWFCQGELDRMSHAIRLALPLLIKRIEGQNGKLPLAASVYLGGELRLARTIQHVVVASMLKRAGP